MDNRLFQFLTLALLFWIAVQVTEAVQGREYTLHLMMALVLSAEAVIVAKVTWRWLARRHAGTGQKRS